MDKKIISSELVMVRGLLCLACTLLIVGCTDQTKVTNVANSPTAPAVENETFAAVQPEEPSPVILPLDDDEREAQAQEKYDALQAEFQKSVKDLRDEIATLESKDDQIRILATKDPSTEYGKRFLELAKFYPDTKASFNATLFVVGQTKGDLKCEAMEYLLNRYADRVKLSKIAASLKQEVPSPDVERWFDLMIEKAKPGPVQASVMLNYSQYLGQLPMFRKTIAINPQVAERLPSTQLEYINAERTDAQNQKTASILNSVIQQYGDLKFQGRETFGEKAASELFELTQLKVGMTVPEIEGEDLDGIPFKLSDYRGKVVMLDFWGHWCPPCRAMYGHEQELTQDLSDQPFVLLGVNSDAEKQTAIDAVRSENLSWRHFWNGPRGTRGPISKQWNVEGWPTVYLIDQHGVIRYKEVLGDEIDRGIETLMAELHQEIGASTR
ncbi:TlpA family protein disulfide reductase [Mariniblastus sp.]|nr:TlpA family protein disulfide reductase [Mariniblastus sp.]MDB4380065.1 TlpA family protein disulfide reductase [Mariniblastus sp.]